MICVPTSDFPKNFVNVVVPTPAAGSVAIDGVLIPAGLYVPIPGSGFSGVQRAVGVGPHVLNILGPVSVPFGVIVYGFAEYDSYGYPGGLFFTDATPPTVTCLNMHVTVQGGTVAGAPCSAVVPDVREVQVSDNCPLSTPLEVTQDPPPGTLIGVGDHIITVSVKDAAGNVGTCTVLLTVLDPSDPTIMCPPEVIANCETKDGAKVFFNVSAKTECGTPLPANCMPPSGSFFPPGTTTVSCVAFANGLSATCTFPVTVRCLSVNFSPATGTLTITWTGGGTLEFTRSLSESFQPLSSGPGQFTLRQLEQQGFFRVRY
jgi:hypothetical protein